MDGVSTSYPRQLTGDTLLHNGARSYENTYGLLLPPPPTTPTRIRKKRVFQYSPPLLKTSDKLYNLKIGQKSTSNVFNILICYEETIIIISVVRNVFTTLVDETIRVAEILKEKSNNISKYSNNTVL